MADIEHPDFNSDSLDKDQLVTTETEIVCPECGGIGEVFWVDICGYVSHEMAMDACDMSYEGQPIYGEVHDTCSKCGGEGYINNEQIGNIDKKV